MGQPFSRLFKRGTEWFPGEPLTKGDILAAVTAGPNQVWEGLSSFKSDGGEVDEERGWVAPDRVGTARKVVDVEVYFLLVIVNGRLANKLITFVALGFTTVMISARVELSWWWSFVDPRNCRHICGLPSRHCSLNRQTTNGDLSPLTTRALDGR